MKIGYCVEGATDAALLHGLRDRWCPRAELIKGRFRGEFRRREIAHACMELQYKGADVIVMLRDANNEDWRDVLKGDEAKCPETHKDLATFGVCDRNVECWLVADRQYASKCTGVLESEFAVEDPKFVFERAMGITPRDFKHDEIQGYVRDAPLKNWLKNPSFENFYERLRTQSRRMSCTIVNLREN